jgi:hypothetical protein
LGNQLRRWEKAHQRKIDLVFFAYIHDRDFKWLRHWFPLLRYPWSGLYLDARFFRLAEGPIKSPGPVICPEKFLTLPSLHSLAVLDERAVEPLRKMTGGKNVAAFPDFTDFELPPPDSPAWGLANKIRRFAGNRKIVVCVGYLEMRKGIREFTRAARHPDLDDFCFFLGGDLTWSGIPQPVRAEMLATWEQSPRVLTHLQRIVDEQAFNCVIAAADIVFAAYTDFPSSSNILTKAAFFERPIIVSEGHLMAERTRDYNLGEIIPEGDVGALVESIKRLGAGGVWKGRWQDYKTLHSYVRLKSAFAELIGARPPRHPAQQT